MRTKIIEKYHADIAQVSSYLAQGRTWPWIQCQMNITNHRAAQMRRTMAKIVAFPSREERERRAREWRWPVA